MNRFLQKWNPVFKNGRISIVMMLLMITILIVGVTRSGVFSHNAQAAVKAGAEKPVFDMGESSQR